MVVSSFRGSRRHVAIGILERHVTLASFRSTSGYVARKSGSKVIGALDQEPGLEPESRARKLESGTRKFGFLFWKTKQRFAWHLDRVPHTFGCIATMTPVPLEFGKVVNPAGRRCIFLENLSPCYMWRSCDPGRIPGARNSRSAIPGRDLEPAGIKDCSGLTCGLDLESAGTKDCREFSEEAIEEDGTIQEESTGIIEEEDACPNATEKDLAVVEMAKTDGTRKRLVKPVSSMAGSTKMRLASAPLSPCKRAAAKAGGRHGGGTKRLEDKGTSNPKLGQQKS
ncbi:hypothetical protein Bca4012_020294 [Brassica carinata]